MLEWKYNNDNNNNNDDDDDDDDDDDNTIFINTFSYHIYVQKYYFTSWPIGSHAQTQVKTNKTHKIVK